jgi:hypothetical protein
MAVFTLHCLRLNDAKASIASASHAALLQLPAF